MYLYGSGFPKSMNIGLAIDKKNGVESEIIGYSDGTMPDIRDVGKKQKKISGIDKLTFGQIENSARKESPIYKAQNEWAGWGTSLKPSYEPIIVARKPCEGTCIDNVLKWGVGGINIDECRVDFVSQEDYKITANKNQHEKFGTLPMTNNNVYGDYSMIQPKNYSATGRFPANTILTYDDSDYDEVCGGFPQSKGASSQNNYSNGHIYRGQSLQESTTSLNGYREWYNDDGSAARYFYCAKASKRDRDEGLEGFEEKQCVGGGGGIGDYLDDVNSCSGKFGSEKAPHKNNHPCVKPTALMQYLVRLVAPKGSTILDPFMGSGSTGKATMYENMDRNADYKFVGIELTDEYLPIAKARIDYVVNHGIILDRGEDETVNEIAEPVEQFNKFDWGDLI